jgi:hypothetical protein
MNQQWTSIDYEMNYNQARLNEKKELNYRQNKYWTNKVMAQQEIL